MSEHTKGPWHVDGGTNKKGDLYIWKEGEYYGGHAIATVHGEIEEGSEPNARLIAAAPELLTACQDLYKIITADELIPESVGYMKQAKTAIAKATE